MTRITLKNVRIAYPHLFTKNSYMGNETGYDAWFLISKSDTENVKKIQTQIDEIQKSLKSKIASDKVCFKDGDLENREYSKGHWVLKSGSKKEKPVVLDQYKRECTQENSPIYSGCFVNVSFDLWLLKNPLYPSRISSNLYAVMFAGDGESIGAGRPSKTEVYSDFDDITPASDDFDDFN